MHALSLLDTICDLLQRYRDMAILPMWPQMRLVLEAGITHPGTAVDHRRRTRLLFTHVHPNLRWQNGVPHIDKMIAPTA